MPEGPELHMTSLFINRVCNGRIFSKIHKSDISKNPVVTPPADKFTICATSRGKEIKLNLSQPVTPDNNRKNGQMKSEPFKTLSIMFTFGLAGKFEFYEASELMKHAHLNFYTADQYQPMVLSFVDYMRFGKWTPDADFSYKDRGPCVLQEYSLFREHVLQNLSSSAFNKPICEALLNQRYFNGIGNYLRAEILHRLKIPPFVSARSVLEPLALKDENGIFVKSEGLDIVQLCNILPKEVIQLDSSWYDGSNRDDTSNNFNNWLQCYYKDGMKNIADHNKRTIWYSGPLGPMAPKDAVTRGKKKGKSRANKGENSTTESEEEEKKVKAKKRSNKQKDESKISCAKKSKKETVEIKQEAQQVPGSPSPKRITRSRVKKAVNDKIKAVIKIKVETEHENDEGQVTVKEEGLQSKTRSRKARGKKT